MPLAPRLGGLARRAGLSTRARAIHERGTFSSVGVVPTSGRRLPSPAGDRRRRLPFARRRLAIDDGGGPSGVVRRVGDVAGRGATTGETDDTSSNASRRRRFITGRRRLALDGGGDPSGVVERGQTTFDGRAPSPPRARRRRGRFIDVVRRSTTSRPPSPSGLDPLRRRFRRHGEVWRSTTSGASPPSSGGRRRRFGPLDAHGASRRRSSRRRDGGGTTSRFSLSRGGRGRARAL